MRILWRGKAPRKPRKSRKKPVKIVTLPQEGPEWHRWRSGGLGGSDAPIIAGDVGWTTPEELLRAKLAGETAEETEAMRRGKRLEPLARQLYELLAGRKMTPCCVVHDDYPWLRASLDGLSDDWQLVLEIKCPRSDGPHRTALAGAVPAYYRAQLQHQLLVTGAPLLHYWSYTDSVTFAPDDRVALVEVLPDREYQEWLFKKEQEFMQSLIADLPPD
jgi:putative phage-type endonuclease